MSESISDTQSNADDTPEQLAARLQREIQNVRETYNLSVKTLKVQRNKALDEAADAQVLVERQYARISELERQLTDLNKTVATLLHALSEKDSHIETLVQRTLDMEKLVLAQASGLAEPDPSDTASEAQISATDTAPGSDKALLAEVVNTEIAASDWEEATFNFSQKSSGDLAKPVS
jgi:uncharacterized coiled-coil protein SlyX